MRRVANTNEWVLCNVLLFVRDIFNIYKFVAKKFENEETTPLATDVTEAGERDTAEHAW